MWKNELLRAWPFRIALAFAIAVAVATIGAFALIYWQVSHDDAQRIERVLAGELSRGYDDSEASLAAALSARQTSDIRRIDYLALFDAAGSTVLGNLARLPPIELDGRPHFLSPETMRRYGGAKEAAILVARRRTDGRVMLLGRTMGEAHEIEDSLRRALTVALAPTIALILAIGVWVGRRALRRLDGVRAAIAQIMQGHLELRLPVSRDNDDVDRVAGAVNLMLDEIARLLDQLKSVGDNIAHDLRTPLALARVKLERALEFENNPAAPKVEAAIEQLDRAAVAIGALLRISAVENGPRHQHFRDVDLAAIAAEAAEFFEPLAQTKSIALTLAGSGEVWMRGDRDLLQEAVANLLDNAIKFTPPGGAVEVAAIIAEGQPRLEVRDDGPGVAAEDRERIFKRFHRASSGEAGHGLGLSIARTICELHGFELTVEDHSPGACFVMRAGAKARIARSAH